LVLVNKEEYILSSELFALLLGSLHFTLECTNFADSIVILRVHNYRLA